MARELDVGFTVFADTKPAVRPMRALNGTIVQTDEQLKKLNKRLKKEAVERQRKFGRAVRATSFVVAGLGLALLKTAKSAGDYDRQIRLAAFLTKNTEERFAEFNAGVKQVASDLGILPTEIARAGQAVGRLGFRGAASLDVLRASATLAAASLGELSGEKAVGAIGTALRSFGRDAEDANIVMDSLTNSVNNTSLNFKKLPLALGTSAGFAAAFGSNLNELLAILGAVNDVIPRTERAATGVRNIFRDLSQSTTAAKLAQAGLNLQIIDASGNFRGIVPILTELFEQTDKMTEAQRLQAFQTAFSIEAATTLAALQERLKTGFEDSTGATIDGVAGLQMLINSMGESGSASLLAAEKLKGFAGAMDKFKTEGALLAESVGRALNTVLVPALNFVTGLVTDMRKAFDDLGPVGRKIVGIFGFVAIAFGFVAAGLIAASFAMGGWRVATLLGVKANIAFLASLGPIGIAILAIIGLVVVFQKQIKQAIALFFRFRRFTGFGGPQEEDQALIDSLEGRVTTASGERVAAPGITSAESIRAQSEGGASESFLERIGAIPDAQAEGGAGQQQLIEALRAAGFSLGQSGDVPGTPSLGGVFEIIMEMDSRKVGMAIIDREQREARRTFRRLPNRTR